jgi:hypothetical protein
VQSDDPIRLGNHEPGLVLAGAGDVQAGAERAPSPSCTMAAGFQSAFDHVARTVCSSAGRGFLSPPSSTGSEVLTRRLAAFEISTWKFAAIPPAARIRLTRRVHERAAGSSSLRPLRRVIAGRSPVAPSAPRSAPTFCCSRFNTRCVWPGTPPFWTWPPAAGIVRASSTSPVAVCDVIRDAGTFGFACHLILDERDCLVERRPARMGVTHRDVLEPDRHATEEDEPVRG